MAAAAAGLPTEDLVQAALAALSGKARIELLPISVRDLGDESLIVRVDRGVVLRTSPAGGEAVSLFRKGYEFGQVQTALGAKFNCPPEGVDLRPLVRTLVMHGLVVKIGALRLPIEPDRPWKRVWLHAKATAGEKSLLAAFRGLPVQLLLNLLYAPGQEANPELLERIRKNLAMASRLPLGEGQRTAVAEQNCVRIRQSQMDRLLLAKLPPRQLERWFRGFTSIGGREHVDEALRTGQRVVLCGFHTGSYALMPYLLASAGYALTALIQSPRAGMAVVRDTARRLGEAGLGSDLLAVTGPYGSRRLVRDLEERRIALILPDALAAGKRSPARVDFLGARLQSSAGLSWLCERSGAAVFPVWILSGSDGTQRMTIGERIPSGPPAARITESAYRRLEAIVGAQPAQWIRWPDFHLMASAQPPPGATS